jgi:hypothetical protein
MTRPRAVRVAPEGQRFTSRVDRRPPLSLHFLDCGKSITEAFFAGRLQRGNKGRTTLLGLLQHPQARSDDFLADIVESTAFHTSLRKALEFGGKINIRDNDALLYQRLV